MQKKIKKAYWVHIKIVYQWYTYWVRITVFIHIYCMHNDEE